MSEYTHLIFEEIERLDNFVTDFLHFAKQPKPKPVATEMKQLLQSTQKLFARQGHTQQVRFHFRLHPDIPPVALDPYQMEQVLVNVIINSLDALPNGGDITFSTFPARINSNGGDLEAVRLEIRDNGGGIAAENLANVFEPFFSTKEAGTGLGLPLSLGIVENHGGRMTISPREGQGTRVTLLLPLKHPEALNSPPAGVTAKEDSREDSIAPV